MVPDAFTVNERVLCPPGATTLDHDSFVAVGVGLGVVEVLLPPHAVAKSAITSHGDTESRRKFPLRLRVFVPPWPVPAKCAALMDV
jgi:hypothetical protein